MAMNRKEAKRGIEITCTHEHCYNLVQVLASTDRKVENGQKKTRTSTFSLCYYPSFHLVHRFDIRWCSI